MERGKAFSNVRKHWSETLCDPSQEIKTEYGTLFVYLNRIHNIRYDGFRPRLEPIFPYGLTNVSSSGELPQMHMYFQAFMAEKIEKPKNREHFLLKVYLPEIEKPYVSGDTFNYGMKQSSFELFGPEGAPDEVRYPTKVLGIEIEKVSKWPGTGLLTIPDDFPITKCIEISLNHISGEEWEKGRWKFHDLVRESEIASYKAFEEERRRPNQLPRNRVINSARVG